MSHGDAMVGYQAQEFFHIESRDDHGRTTLVQAKVHDHDHAVDVEKRQHCDQRVLFRHLAAVGRGGCLKKISDQVGVRQHHTFGQAGRATRIRQYDDVLAWIDRLLSNRVAVQEGRIRRGACSAVKGDDLFNAGTLDRLISLVEKHADSEQNAGARIG